MPEQVDRLVEQTDAVLASWRSVDPARLDPWAVTAGLRTLHEAEAKLAAVQAGWLAAAHATDATVAECGRSTRSFLVEELYLSPGSAGRRMRLAHGLPEAPELAAALGDGWITAEHALVILAVLPQIADAELRALVETALVEFAKSATPPEVARAVDEVLARLGVEKGRDAHDRRYARRGVGVETTFGGCGSLNGTLTPPAREKLVAALESAGAAAGPDDPRSRRERWHDGLEALADFYLGHADTVDPVRGERPRVVVTIDHQTLLQQLADGWATLDSGVPVTAETARRLACDAGVLPVVLGGAGEVLDVGRTSRTFTLATRRAAWLRQGGRCAYPGCRRPPVECHHVVWWSHGGRSDLDNAAWLCAFHHWLVHEGGWTMTHGADGPFRFTDPYGEARPVRRHSQAG